MAWCVQYGSFKKISEGERLPNKAQLNDDGIEYSIAQTKDLYLDLTLKKKTNHYINGIGRTENESLLLLLENI